MYKLDQLEQVIIDEETIRFDSFDNDDAIELFCVFFDLAKEKGVHVCCQIMIGDFVVARGFGNGTDESNIPFLNRKSNCVYKSGKSSIRCGMEVELENMGEDWYADSENYITKGGAFPILKKDGTVMGVICVSGLFHVDDHDLAVQVLKKYREMRLK